MQIKISGRRIDVGDALTGYIEDRIEAIVEKYFTRSLEATVTVGKKGPFFQVDCTLHVHQGIHLQSRAEADDAHAAFDLAADKMEKQLRRHKRRLKDRHATARAGQEEEVALMAQAYVLKPEEESESADTDSGESSVNGMSSDVADDNPVIIAETRTEVPKVSVGDAVMLMDLSDQPALMFRNLRNGRVNVVYRRPDGNIGWIAPVES
jgi:ribosomal subunit interface protein